jgi:hypothetical protein
MYPILYMAEIRQLFVVKLVLINGLIMPELLSLLILELLCL